MKKSARNLAVIQNFLLHLTHCDNYDGELDWKTEMTFTPEVLYQVALDYIKEDHVDGEDNPEDHIVTYGAESSYQHEDKDKEHEEYVVVVADYGDDGTETVATFDNADNLKAVNDLLDLIKKNQ